MTDTNCNIVDINQAGRILFSVTIDSPLDLLSLNCCSSGPENEDNKPVIQQEILSKGYVNNFETTLHRPDGCIRYCIMTASARYNELEQILRIEGILRDITEEKQRQEAERSSRKQLQE